MRAEEQLASIPLHLQLKLALAAKAEYTRQIRDEGLQLDPALLRTVNKGIARLQKQLGLTTRDEHVPVH